MQTALDGTESAVSNDEEQSTPHDSGYLQCRLLTKERFRSIIEMYYNFLTKSII